MGQDFLDFLSSLDKNLCEYVVVGGYAMGAWGYIRATGDLDVFINPTKENGERVMTALTQFGAPLSGVNSKDFSQPGIVFQIGVPPFRIDIVTLIDGVAFPEALREAHNLKLLGRSVRVLSLNHLILNKKTSGRPKDLADLEELEALKRK